LEQWGLFHCHDGFWWGICYENDLVVVAASCVVAQKGGVVEVGLELREGVIAVKVSVY
jgi:hypothetical protein